MSTLRAVPRELTTHNASAVFFDPIYFLKVNHHRFDAVVKAVILDACLGLHADAAAYQLGLSQFMSNNYSYRLAAENIESKHEARFSGDHTSRKPSKVAGTSVLQRQGCPSL